MVRIPFYFPRVFDCSATGGAVRKGGVSMGLVVSVDPQRVAAHIRWSTIDEGCVGIDKLDRLSRSVLARCIIYRRSVVRRRKSRARINSVRSARYVRMRAGSRRKVSLVRRFFSSLRA